MNRIQPLIGVDVKSKKTTASEVFEHRSPVHAPENNEFDTTADRKQANVKMTENCISRRIDRLPEKNGFQKEDVAVVEDTILVLKSNKQS